MLLCGTLLSFLVKMDKYVVAKFEENEEKLLAVWSSFVAVKYRRTNNCFQQRLTNN